VVGQNPLPNRQLRMRNKLNNKTAAMCQRTSPGAHLPASLVSSFQALAAPGSAFRNRNDKLHLYAMWMRRMTRPLPVMCFILRQTMNY
jgi:hypothetical protein